MAKNDNSLGAALGLTTNGGMNKRQNPLDQNALISDLDAAAAAASSSRQGSGNNGTTNSLPTGSTQATVVNGVKMGATDFGNGSSRTRASLGPANERLARLAEQTRLAQEEAKAKADQEAADAQAKAEQEAADAKAKAEQEAAEAEAKAEQDTKDRLAAEHQSLISGDNVLAVQNQLARQLENYDFADEMNRRLADRQLMQNSAKTSSDRFEAQRDLLGAATGLFGSMGNAMNGSALGNLMTMLEQRNDKENNTYWTQHQMNQNAVENSYLDSLNQNLFARRDAMQSAEKAIRDIESDWAANLNNINPELFQQGAVNGIGHLSSTTAWKDNPYYDRVQGAQTGSAPYDSGYYARQNATPTGSYDYYGSNRGNDYFAQMMSRFDGRR